MISWPAANEIRWVNPSMATVSPSRTSWAIASAMDATFELPVTRRSWRGDLAVDDLVDVAPLPRVVKCLTRILAHGVNGLAE